jgi:hypothetical protein
MGLLEKLLSSPERFARDSRVYRSALVTASQLRDRARRAMGAATATSPAAPATLTDRLLGVLSQRAAITDVGDGAHAEYGILRNDVHLLAAALIELAASPELQLSVKRPPVTLDCRQASIYTLDAFLVAGAGFTVIADDRATHERALLPFQLWTREDTQVVGPRPNRVARRISAGTRGQHGLFTPGALTRTRDLLPAPLVTAVDFPIDVVYTWVNHRDPGWQRLRASVDDRPLADVSDDAASIERFISRDELRYSLRSVMEFAPWVRTIHVVTNCARPPWLRADHPRLRWVDHTEIIPAEHLPTFSSHAIESRLQHVPGLAEHFLYFNDDMFLARPTLPSDFFEMTGMSKAFLEDYGSVNGPPRPGEPDYLNAARNGSALLRERYGRVATALHRHTPYALRRDVLLDMEREFAGPIGRTTAQKFRTIDDISTVSFLHHHVGYLTGRTTLAPCDALLIHPRLPRYEQRLEQLVERARTPISVCLNDGGGSSRHPHWDHHVQVFLDAFMPKPCELELAAGAA